MSTLFQQKKAQKKKEKKAQVKKKKNPALPSWHG